MLLLLAMAAVDFDTQVKPLLESACLSCHGPARVYGDLRVDSAEAIRKVLVPGDPDKSALVRRAAIPPEQTGSMPPGGPALKPAQIAMLRAWVAEGANWPAGAKLGARAPKRKDDASLAADLHARIAAGKQPARMEAYKAAIPGSGVFYEMVPIPGGGFSMGTPESEPGHRKDESPVHQVIVEPFWMQKFEVSWDEYRLFMFSENQADPLVDAVSHPTRPYVEMSFGMGINGFPAISMTQHAANKYAQWLSAKTGHFYRLPSEAEWEYACRAGTAASPAALGESAWFADNSNGKYQKVGTRKPNAWGLHDMLGNVMEWTLDQYRPYSAGPASMPWVKARAPYPHAVRGGSWNDDAEKCRCGARVASDSSWKMQDPQLPKSIWYHTDAQWLGFRLVRPLRVPPAAGMQAYWNSGVQGE